MIFLHHKDNEKHEGGQQQQDTRFSFVDFVCFVVGCLPHDENHSFLIPLSEKTRIILQDCDDISLKM